MAQRTVVSLVDDLDGSEAGETVSFGLDGKQYEIDLNKKNAENLRKALAPYVESARKLARNGQPYRRVKVRADSAEIRAWAKAKGIELSDRGRIPSSVVKEYEASR